MKVDQDGCRYSSYGSDAECGNGEEGLIEYEEVSFMVHVVLQVLCA